MDLPMPVVCLGHRHHMCLSALSFRAPGAPKLTVIQCRDPAPLSVMDGAGLGLSLLLLVLPLALPLPAWLCCVGARRRRNSPSWVGRRGVTHEEERFLKSGEGTLGTWQSRFPSAVGRAVH